MRRREFALLVAGTMLAPRTGGAQQRQLPLVGFLHGSAPVGQYRSYVDRFFAGLKQEGFDPESNMHIPATVRFVDPITIEIQGCALLVICKTQRWTKVD